MTDDVEEAPLDDLGPFTRRPFNEAQVRAAAAAAMFPEDSTT